MIIKELKDDSLSSDSSKVAIVGVGCWYPGSRNKKELWENILSSRQQFRRIPDVRLPLSEYQDDNRLVPDKTYGTKSAVIDGYEFDWQAHRIPKSTYESTDIVHWFALDVALQMLADAGYKPGDLPKETTQVIVGNTLTGEFTRSNTMRLRWPFVDKILRSAAADLPSEALDSLSGVMEKKYKSVFSPVNEDTLAGGLSNTIAGRICNYLNVNGGGFTVDGACSSSLIAVHNAASNLINGTADFAIAGGVDVSIDPFEIIGFAKTGALTPTDMSVYDKRGNGFIPGEGCGFVGLKRLDDAKRDGNKIYAVLDGWGMSSDGKGGITAPSVAGQSIALQRAYQQAGIDPQDIDFIEGHGTGTTLGDKTELLAIADALKSKGGVKQRSCGVTSFKSVFGHTKAAAGIGALIKAALATNQRVVPPTAGCDHPHDVFSNESSSLYPVKAGKSHAKNRSFRSGVSAMGFGGINLHVTLSAGDTTDTGLQPDIGERAAMASRQDTELFCLAAASLDQLCDNVKQLLAQAQGASIAEMVDIAKHLNDALSAPSVIDNHPVRAAVIAGSPNELVSRLITLLSAIENNHIKEQDTYIDKENAIIVANNTRRSTLGFIFPGQGSQKLNSAQFLIERFQWARDLLESADRWAAELGTHDLATIMYAKDDTSVSMEEQSALREKLKQTQYSQPIVVVSSLLWLTFIKKLGVSANSFLGHSLGELTAFHAAGAITEQELVKLAVIRGQQMAKSDSGETGSMVSLECDQTRAEKLLKQLNNPGYLVIANINSHLQTVVSGDDKAVSQLIVMAKDQGVECKQLPVSNAFHSKMVAGAANYIKSHAPIAQFPHAIKGTLVSSMQESAISQTMDLHVHFSSQITQPVNFVKAVEQYKQCCDMAIEVGSGGVLTNLVNSFNNGLNVYSLEPRPRQFFDMNWTIATLFAAGHEVNFELLYQQRIVKPFTNAKDLQFIVNPCEREFDSSSADLMPYIGHSNADHHVAAGLLDVKSLGQYLQQRGDFIESVIKADIHSLGGSETYAQAKKPQNIVEEAINKAKRVPLEAPNNDVGISAAIDHRGDVHQQPTVANVDIDNEIKKLVAEFTGFDQETLSMSLRISDDLNLDSIKSGELVGRIVAKLGLQGEVDVTEYANSTLADIVHLGKGQLNAGVAASHHVDVAKNVIDIAAKMTGFATENLSIDSLLLDDLNLDSIKTGSLIAESCMVSGVDPGIDTSSIAADSLGDIATQINALLPSVTSSSAASVSALDVLIDVSATMTGFDKSAILPTFSLVDDLNLDSIKISSVIASAETELGIQGIVDPADAASQSLQEMAKKMQLAIAPSESPASAKLPKGNNQPDSNKLANYAKDWVRSFDMLPHASPLDDVVRPSSYENGRVAIQYPHTEKKLAEKLAEKIKNLDADVSLLTEKQLDASEAVDITHIIVLLPRQSVEVDSQSLLDSVSRLHVSSIASKRQTECKSITYVQFDGIADNKKSKLGNCTSACAMSFAASVHLERPKLNVRVINVSSAIKDDDFIKNIIQESRANRSYSFSHYNKKNLRHEFSPSLVELGMATPDGIAWGVDDVVVVTGGAKGITAECALAFAKKTGVKMFLVGSSAINEKAMAGEIGATLARYENEGLFVKYCQCNITDANSVQQMIDDITKEHGSISGIIHGAGMNNPKVVEQVSVEQALREVSPKVLGLINLCDAVKQAPPKLIIGLSSIIGITGMPGNAWYAFSNETLALILQTYQAKNKQTKTVALAYSVWEEVGMGARMGSDKQLAKTGISAISVAEGVDKFLHAATKCVESPHLVVAGRLGGLDTWHYAENPMAHNSRVRFLGKIVSFHPKVELVNQVHLNVADDLYLLDHYYRGVYLFPTVFGLEAMAQSVAAVLDMEALPPLNLVDISLERPIVVASDRGITIQITASVSERKTVDDALRVEVGISTEQTGFKRNHFSATFVLQQPALNDIESVNEFPKQATDIHPQTELYGGLLFQGPLFQRLEKVWSMTDDYSQISIEHRPEKHYFSSKYSSQLLLGDPSFRDVLLQSAQLSEKDTYLPVRIKQISIHQLKVDKPKSYLAENTITARIDDELHCDVVARSSDGRLVEVLSHYQLKRMEVNNSAPLPKDWVNPDGRDKNIFFESLRSRCKQLNVSSPSCALNFFPTLSKMEKNRRRVSETSLLFDVVVQTLPDIKDMAQKEFEVQWQKNGKPYIKGLQDRVDISLSHDNQHCLCISGGGPQGCDIEPIQPRPYDEWVRLLSTKYQSLLDSLTSKDESKLSEAGTRIWSAIEAAKKAFVSRDVLLSMTNKNEDTILFSATCEGKSIDIITYPIQLTRLPTKMVAMTVEKVMQPADNTVADDITDSDGHHRSGSHEPFKKGDNGQIYTHYPFRVTFKDTTTPLNHVNFSNFATWMGNVRELGVKNIANDLVSDFTSGRWGMVTNHSDVQMLSVVNCLDFIEGRMNLSRVHGKFDSSIDMNFDWVKVRDNGEEELVARSKMTTTWVEITGHGVVDVKPFPEYLQKYIVDFLPNENQRVAPTDESLLLDMTQRYNLGEHLYQAPKAPKVEPVLRVDSFKTTLAESNLVSNIYFSNYYIWSSRVIDSFVQDYYSKMLIDGDAIGELRCNNCQIKHLREAMPFDTIEVSMSLKSLYEKGMILYFEYYKVIDKNQRVKLANGIYEGAFFRKNSDQPSDFPDELRSSLLDSLPSLI